MAAGTVGRGVRTVLARLSYCRWEPRVQCGLGLPVCNERSRAPCADEVLLCMMTNCMAWA